MRPTDYDGAKIPMPHEEDNQLANGLWFHAPFQQRTD